MNYLVENATAIMQLCFGFGFIVLVAFSVRPLILITRILSKANALIDIFTEYIEKPLKVLMAIHKSVSGVMNFFKKD